ncbi:MAG: hypothetical protein AB1428_05490 [Bacteroidota bacterium]
MPSIEISFSAPASLAVLLMLTAAVLSYFFYRSTVPAVPRRRRLALSILRGTALALLLALICEPLLRLVHVTSQRPVIAVLADNSASMGIADRTGNRRAALAALLHSTIPASAPDGAEVEYHAFGTTLGPSVSALPESLDCTDELTDLAGAIKSLARTRESSDLKAVVLLTDGVYTIGENPIHEAERPGIPMFTIGIGDTAEQKDVVLSRVMANDIVYAGSLVPVDLTIKSSGFAGERVEVQLREGSHILARTPLTLPAATTESAAQLTFVPETEGVHRYTAAVTTLSGELSASNNERRFTVRVLKSKLRLLVVAGGPSPDLVVVRQTLAEDPNFTVVARIQKAAGGFYERPLAQREIDSADCIVTLGMPTTRSDAATLDMIGRAIVEQQKPLLFLAGNDLDYARLATMAPSLPVAVTTPATGELEVEFVPDARQAANPLLTTDRGPGPWDRMPPLFAAQAVYRLREGSILLGSPRLRNVVLRQPLIATRNAGGTKSYAILAYGLWRWRLMAQGSVETAWLFPSFLRGAVVWLSARDEGKAVRVAPTKDAFARGERIEFSGQVYDASARPVDRAQLRVTLTSQDQSLETELRPIGNGRYEGEVEGLPQGEYAYHARASSDGTELGRDGGTFTVGGLNLEFLDTRMNAGLLQQLAYRTGGRYFTHTTAAGLRGALDSLRTMVPRNERRAEAIELPQWHYILGIIVFLFATEWVIRKRSGML